MKTFLLFFALAFSFEVPKLTGPVVDEANLLDRKDYAYLDETLRNLNSEGTQLQVLTLQDIGNETIEQASIKVVDKWKLGTKKEDKGVLLFVVKKQRKVRIEVGQGLEGVLTDLDSKRIIREQIVPYFKANQYSQGIVAGVTGIILKTNPDFKNLRSPEKALKLPPLLILLLIFLFIIIIFSRFFGGGYGGFGGGGGYGGGGWGGGGFGGGGSSGGSWGGGGGGFSGGGASGDW
jgi:uncharacterized protein